MKIVHTQIMTPQLESTRKKTPIVELLGTVSGVPFSFPTFGVLLARLMKGRRSGKLTYREFAEMVGVPPTKTSHYVSGIRTPPLEKLDRMIEVLELEGAEIERFKKAAYLAHCPEEMRRLIAELESQLTQAAKQNALLLKQNALIFKELERLGVQIPQVDPHG